MNRTTRLVLLIAALLMLVAAVPLAAHGVRVDQFPSFVSAPATSAAGSGPAKEGGSVTAVAGTPITHFSPPWIAGAAGLVLLGLVVMAMCLAEPLRAAAQRRSGHRPGTRTLED